MEVVLDVEVKFQDFSKKIKWSGILKVAVHQLPVYLEVGVLLLGEPDKLRVSFQLLKSEVLDQNVEVKVFHFKNLIVLVLEALPDFLHLPY